MEQARRTQKTLCSQGVGNAGYENVNGATKPRSSSGTFQVIGLWSCYFRGPENPSGWKSLEAATNQPCISIQKSSASSGQPPVQGLEELTRLEILDVSTNQVQRLQGLSTLTHLKDLWVNDNAIESLEHLAEDLQAPKARWAFPGGALFRGVCRGTWNRDFQAPDVYMCKGVSSQRKLSVAPTQPQKLLL